MTILSWDRVRDDLIELGVDRGVLYLENDVVAWNGLTSIEDDSNPAEEAMILHFDGRPYKMERKAEISKVRVQAWTYPDEFESYFDSNQRSTHHNRPKFGFSYRSEYLIHIFYGCTAIQQPTKWSTVTQQHIASPFIWDIRPTPDSIYSGFHLASHLVVDTSVAEPEAIQKLENALYGTETEDPYLPTPDDVLGFWESLAPLVVIDFGDGTWAADGPDEAFAFPDDHTFQITWPTAVYLDGVSYTISSGG